MAHNKNGQNFTDGPNFWQRSRTPTYGDGCTCWCLVQMGEQLLVEAFRRRFPGYVLAVQHPHRCHLRVWKTLQWLWCGSRVRSHSLWRRWFGGETAELRLIRTSHEGNVCHILPGIFLSRRNENVGPSSALQITSVWSCWAEDAFIICYISTQWGSSFWEDILLKDFIAFRGRLLNKDA